MEKGKDAEKEAEDSEADNSKICHSESESSSIQNMNYTGPSVPKEANLPTVSTDRDGMVVMFIDKSYVKSCTGLLRLIQVLFSIISLASLSSAGNKEGDFLQLPLSWHFRVMVFVLILSTLTSLSLWFIHASNLISALPLNWYLMDFVLYSLFSFLYLLGSSLVANAFDFYERVRADIPRSTNQKIIFCVVLGYICMCLYGLTALVGYRRWNIQQKLFKRRRLLEEEQDVEI